MENKLIMNIVGQVNMVNRYKKGLYFAAGIIIIGGIAYYVIFKQYQKLNNRIANIERTQTLMSESIQTTTYNLHGFNDSMQQLAKDQFNLMAAVLDIDKVVRSFTMTA